MWRLSGLLNEQLWRARDGRARPLAGSPRAGPEASRRRQFVHKAGSVRTEMFTFVRTKPGQITPVLPPQLWESTVASAPWSGWTKDQSQGRKCLVQVGRISRRKERALWGFANSSSTTPVVMATGEGTVRYRNEQIDLAITGHPKKNHSFIRCVRRSRSRDRCEHFLLFGVEIREAPSSQADHTLRVSSFWPSAVARFALCRSGPRQRTRCGALLAQAKRGKAARPVAQVSSAGDSAD